MHNDGTMRCGISGCKCETYKQDSRKINSTFIKPDRCRCGHTRINHYFNTRDHLFDKGESEK